MKSTTDIVSPVPFLDLVRQYEEIKVDMDEAIASVVSSASFIGGSHVRDFEQAFGGYVGAEQCIGVGNGTDAIEIALEAADLRRAGEVILPAASFIATSEAVTRAGFRVVFADVDPDTYTLDVADVERRITPDTVAILAVHLYGHPAPMVELLELAGRHGLPVFEDAAQAHGAEVDGRRVGTLGRAATFSFYPGKNLGAYGDAGAITTQDNQLGLKMRMLANHGRTSKYAHEFEGRNSRLDSLQAAILSVKLRHLDRWTDRRRAVAALYREELSGIEDLILPVERSGCKHVYHLFVVRSSDRNALQDHLESTGISTGIHYPQALPRLGAYASHPQHREDFFADRMSDEVLSLPMGDSIDLDQAGQVAAAVRAFYQS